MVEKDAVRKMAIRSLLIEKLKNFKTRLSRFGARVAATGGDLGTPLRIPNQFRWMANGQEGGN